MRFSPHNLVSEVRNWIKETSNVHYFAVDVEVTHLNRLRISSFQYYEALKKELAEFQN